MPATFGGLTTGLGLANVYAPPPRTKMTISGMRSFFFMIGSGSGGQVVWKAYLRWMSTSTRRLSARPEAVALLAIGCRSA